jgi:hypothetical protein
MRSAICGRPSLGRLRACRSARFKVGGSPRRARAGDLETRKPSSSPGDARRKSRAVWFDAPRQELSSRYGRASNGASFGSGGRLFICAHGAGAPYWPLHGVRREAAALDVVVRFTSRHGAQRAGKKPPIAEAPMTWLALIDAASKMRPEPISIGGKHGQPRGLDAPRGSAPEIGGAVYLGYRSILGASKKLRASTPRVPVPQLFVRDRRTICDQQTLRMLANPERQPRDRGAVLARTITQRRRSRDRIWLGAVAVPVCTLDARRSIAGCRRRGSGSRRSCSLAGERRAAPSSTAFSGDGARAARAAHEVRGHGRRAVAHDSRRRDRRDPSASRGRRRWSSESTASRDRSRGGEPLATSAG